MYAYERFFSKIFSFYLFMLFLKITEVKQDADDNYPNCMNYTDSNLIYTSLLFLIYFLKHMKKLSKK